MSRRIEQIFPLLQQVDSYTITSPASLDYNCIAWAAGHSDRLWWPDENNIGFWPSGAPRDETIEAFVETFAGMGYTICDDAEYEGGFEKIAIYVDSKGKPTHASRQLAQGRWTSKLGRLEDIEHTTDGLNGDEYGSIAIIMKRPA